MGLEFEQLPRESNKAFAAFSLYLNMGPERSLEAVARQLHKSKNLLGRWSAKFDWPARVQAHGAHLAMVERQATEAVARSKAAEWLSRQSEQRDEEWRVRGELLEAGREALRRWKANVSRCGSLEGIARMLELASKLGRLASGMPTDHTEVTGEVTVNVDVEWEVALKKVYGGKAETAKAESGNAAVVDVEVVPGSQRRLTSAATGTGPSEAETLAGETDGHRPPLQRREGGR